MLFLMPDPWARPDGGPDGGVQCQGLEGNGQVSDSDSQQLMDDTCQRNDILSKPERTLSPKFLCLMSDFEQARLKIESGEYN